nr:putative ribonuclease H-like domain-containing protein [Tanacetum cinerariifolium]
MASKQSSSGPALHEMTPTTISPRLMPKPTSSTPFVPSSRIDWDLLFQPLFDELLTPPPSVDHPAPEVIAQNAKVVAQEPDELTSSLIQQYLQHEHYALWEVIEFGDSYEAPTTVAATGSASEGTATKKGRTIAFTTKDMQKRKNDVKARTTLLMALPDEHQLRCKIEQDELNQKFLTSLAPEWLMHTIVWRNRSDLDTMSLDDLYNHLKSFMENKEDDHALVADEEAPTEFALMAKTSAESKVFDNSLCSKNCLSQVEGRLLEFKNQEIKFYEKIRVLKFSVECKTNRIKNLTNKLELLKKEKEGLESKLTGFQSASKDLNSLLESQILDKNKKRLGYSAVPSSCSSLFSSQEGFVLDRIPSVPETEASHSTISSKPFIKFLKAADPSIVAKLNKKETVRKPSVKYAELYRKPTKRKFPTGNTKFSTADLGNKGTAVKASACWIWKPTQNLSNIGSNSNCVSVMFKKYTYTDTQGRLNGCSWHMTGNISYLSDYEPFDGGYVSFGQGGYKITGKGTIKIGKLEFENVYFVKDLKYNLFSVSQVCDNKNNVLFTDLECIVLGRDFKLIDDTNDETSGILRNFITEIENLKELRTPAIEFLKPVGCHVMILNTLDNLGKFEAKGDEGYFIGYSMSSQAFRVFNKRTKRVEENLHVYFLENKPIEKGVGPNWLFNIDFLTNFMNYGPVMVAGTSSTNFSGTKKAAGQNVKKYVSSLRYIVLPNWFYETHLESSTSNAQDACNANDSKSSGNSNPTATSTNPPTDHMETLAVETLIPTVSSPILTVCLNDSLEPSSDTRLISLTNRFEDILGVTTNTDDTIRVEADLGNMETTITASPTLTLRIHKDHLKRFTVYQMDVKSVFLYDTIDEEVYVMQPPRFQDPEFPARVYKVEKAMYRLHQAPRAWYGTFSKYLLTNGFQRGTIDQTLFIRRHRGDFILVQVYVDDIMFGSSNPQLCREFEAPMHEKFQMSAMGELNIFLGLKVLQKEDGIFLSQDKYVG